jgi:hypothetical protein
MAGELKFNEVTTPSTPAAGKDSLFASNATPSILSRVDSAGTVWTYAPEFILTNTADFTQTNNGSAEKALNGSTNGQITLPASMSYNYELMYLITNTGTTSHTWGTLFGGTATLTSVARVGMSVTATSNALTAPSWIYSTAATVLVLTAASTSATENVIIKEWGTIRINGAGTLIPQIKASAATTGTAKTLANSYFKLTQFGADTSASLGPWS